MQENKFKCYMAHEYDIDLYDYSSLYKNMFIEDVRQGIIPIKLNQEEDKTKIIIDGDDSDSTKLKTILNSFNHNSETTHIEKLAKYAIESIASEISWYGTAIYEIYQKNDDELKFINLIPDKFINLKFFYIQIPPKKNRLSYKFIKKTDIWEISIPKELQKNYSYKRILSSIDKFDSDMPKPLKDNLLNGNNEFFKYDSKKYIEKQFLYVNNLTSDWGWHQRNMSEELTTEFLRNYKYLKFYLSQALFREHIIKELNKLFKSLEMEVSITIEGIPSSKDYEKQIRKYISHEIGYEDVFKFNY